MIHVVSRARFLSLAWNKLRLCSANHRPGYWSNLPCDWPSIAWAYSEQETENGPSTSCTFWSAVELNPFERSWSCGCLLRYQTAYPSQWAGYMAQLSVLGQHLLKVQPTNKQQECLVCNWMGEQHSVDISWWSIFPNPYNRHLVICWLVWGMLCLLWIQSFMSVLY